MGVPTPAGDTVGTAPEAQAATNATTDDSTTSTPDGTVDNSDSKDQAPEAKAAEAENKAPETEAQNTEPENTDPEDDSEDQNAEDDSADDLTDDDLEALEAKSRRAVSKVRRENANLRDRLAKETRRADRAEVAHQAELPPDAVKFLTGETREELETNAADLLAMLGQGGRVTPGGLPTETSPGDGTPPAPAVTPESELDNSGSRMYGN